MSSVQATTDQQPGVIPCPDWCAGDHPEFGFFANPRSNPKWYHESTRMPMDYAFDNGGYAEWWITHSYDEPGGPMMDWNIDLDALNSADARKFARALLKCADVMDRMTGR